MITFLISSKWQFTTDFNKTERNIKILFFGFSFSFPSPTFTEIHIFLKNLLNNILFTFYYFFKKSLFDLIIPLTSFNVFLFYLLTVYPT